MRRNQPSKADIVRAIISAASAYNQNLVGKTFLYVFDGRYIEVLFKTQNFCHLTGVETSSSARPFYRDTLRGRLYPGQIWFTSRHPYNLCVLKISHIQNLHAMTNSRVIILENTATETVTYEFGLTELRFTLCLGKDTDADGNVKSGYYVVKSLRDGDCLNRSGHHHRCDFIFSKRNDERLYNTLCYVDGTIGVDALPDEVKLMVSVDGENIIKSAFLPSGPSTDHQPVDGVVDSLVDGASTEVDEVMAVLQATIDTLQEQLKVKDLQIEQQAQTITRLTDALVAAQQTAAAAQALHAGTMHQQLLSGEASADQQSDSKESEPEQKRSWFSKFFWN